MNKIIPLMRREWLQHRWGWAWMTLLPLGLGLLLTAFGEVSIGDGERVGEGLPVLMAFVSIAAVTGLLFIIVWISSLIITSGLARRDHNDRSIEFWMSLPVSHTASLSAPMLVHLLLAPAAALLIGLLGGYVISAVLVTRVSGFGAWLALPWGDVVPATLAVLGRLLIGLPLATLWLLPLILLAVLLTAWFRKWGWIILAVGIGLGSTLLNKVFGQPLLSDLLNRLMQNAARALVTANENAFNTDNADGVFSALRHVPAWAGRDLLTALGAAASPLMLGGLLFSAACFALLVQWRQRGAGGVA